jgi:hypothetical protein
MSLSVQTIEQILSEAKPEDHPKAIAIRIMRALMQAGEVTQKAAAELCEKVWPAIVALAENRNTDAALILDDLFEELGQIRYGEAAG